MFDDTRSDKQDTCEQMTAEHTQGTRGSARKESKMLDSIGSSVSNERERSPDSRSSHQENQSSPMTSTKRGNCELKAVVLPATEESAGVSVREAESKEIVSRPERMIQEDLKSKGQSHQYRPYTFWNCMSLGTYKAGLSDVVFKLKLCSIFQTEDLEKQVEMQSLKFKVGGTHSSTHNKVISEQIRKDYTVQNLPNKKSLNPNAKKNMPQAYPQTFQHQQMIDYSYSNAQMGYQHTNNYSNYGQPDSYQGTEWNYDPYGMPMANYAAYGYQPHHRSNQPHYASPFPEAYPIENRSTRRQA